MNFDLSALLPFIAVGFAAQLVDGALGMAFGVISNTLLVAFLGVPPAVASQRVHLVECFTTATSGISHLLHGNIDKRLFLSLVIPGVIGGVLGAYVLTSLDAEVVKPFVLLYLSAPALAVMAWAPKGTMLNAPDTYMDKIACGPGYPAGVIDLDKSPADNVKAIAKAKKVKPSDITVCVLDRPRHAEIIATESGGSPFFVDELVRHVQAGLLLEAQLEQATSDYETTIAAASSPASCSASRAQ